MNNPFKNDPFALVWSAFKNLYPDKNCECWFDVVDDPNDVDGHYGWTEWHDDGTITLDTTMKYVYISKTNVKNAYRKYA